MMDPGVLTDAPSPSSVKISRGASGWSVEEDAADIVLARLVRAPVFLPSSSRSPLKIGMGMLGKEDRVGVVGRLLPSVRFVEGLASAMLTMGNVL